MAQHEMPQGMPQGRAQVKFEKSIYSLGMIFFRLAYARRSIGPPGFCEGFAQAGNRYPSRIKSRTGFFGVMRVLIFATAAAQPDGGWGPVLA